MSLYGAQRRTKLRLTVHSAKNLAKKDLFRLPDSFAKIVVDSSGQCHTTEVVKTSLDPKWNQHYDLFLSRSDSISISIWNYKKVHKRQGAGFLGCVRLSATMISRIKDSGYQRLNLAKSQPDDDTIVRGQVIVSLTSRDQTGGVSVVDSDVSVTTAQSLLSEHDDQLPDGWELRHTPLGREYYVNHYTKSTQWEHPTRPGYESVSSTNSAGRNATLERHPGNVSMCSHPTSLATSLSPVATTTSTQPATDIPTTRTFSIGSNLRRRVSTPCNHHNNHHLRVRPISMVSMTTNSDLLQDNSTDDSDNSEGLQSNQNGHVVDRSNQGGSHDPRLLSTVARRLWEKQLSVDDSSNGSHGSATLSQKIKQLRAQLIAIQPAVGHCRVEVSRDEIFEESYRQIMKMSPKDLKKKLMVKFKTEDGLDYGGIAREWLHLLSRQMLNPYYGLFQYSRDDAYTLQINPNSAVNPEHLSYFRFVGRILGISVFHGHHVDGGFTLPFYKQLLGLPITLDDMAAVDPSIHQSFHWMLNNDITGLLEHTFCANYDRFGQLMTHELIPGGQEIPVTQENKQEYVHHYVQWYFKRGIDHQLQAVQNGFNELIPRHLLSDFDEKELELIINGVGKIDICDWKSNTRLKHCTADTCVVKWFWQVVTEYSDERRAQLLQFVTGSSRVPIEGFKALQGSTGAAGPRLFTIHLSHNMSTDSLPKAHTCFNRVDLPPYEAMDKLKEKLTCAIEETAGFHVE